MIRLFLIFFAHLPLKFNHFLGAFLGFLLYVFNTNTKKITQKNLALCMPELSPKAHEKISKNSLIHFGKGLTELALIWYQSIEKNKRLIKKVTGGKNIMQKEAIIILAPHLGCWELIARFCAHIREITVLYKSPSNKQKDNLLYHARKAKNIHLVDTSIKGLIKLQNAIKQKHLIGILPDQTPTKQKNSVNANFFNIPTPTMTLLVKLARKYRIRIVMTWINRLNFGDGFEINFKPIEVVSADNDIKSDCNLMNHHIENLIRQYPTQYLWQYKRFKHIIKY